jgi:hypothetical protein
MKTLAVSLLYFFLFTLVSCGAEKNQEKTIAAREYSAKQPEDPVVALVEETAIYRSQVEAQMSASNRIYQALENSLSSKAIEEKKRETRRQILDNLIEQQIILNHTKEIENSLTGKDEERIETAWQNNFNNIAGYVKKTYPNLEQEELTRQVETMLKAASGQNLEDARKNTRNAVLGEILRDAVGAGTEQPTTQEISEYYQHLLWEQKRLFNEDVSRYEQALLAGDIVVYRPGPCRIIREINLLFDDDVIALMRQLAGVDAAADAEKMRQDQFKRQEEKVQRILEKLKSLPFETVIQEECGKDTQPARNYISSGSRRFGEDYKNTAMNIPARGMSGRPIRSQYGTLIVYWEGNTTGQGETPLAELYDTIQEKVWQEKQKLRWEETKAQWLKNAGIVLFPENLN